MDGRRLPSESFGTRDIQVQASRHVEIPLSPFSCHEIPSSYCEVRLPHCHNLRDWTKDCWLTFQIQINTLSTTLAGEHSILTPPSPALSSGHLVSYPIITPQQSPPPCSRRML